MSEFIKKEHCDHCAEFCCHKCMTNLNAYVFESLSNDQLERLMTHKREVTFNPGETILKQNTTTTHFVCIRNGLAKVVSEGPKGKNLILRLINKHSLLTAGGVISDDVRQFTITAISKVECCFVDSERLQNLLIENCKFSYELLRYNNKWNIDLLNRLVNLTHKYMPGRIADTVLYLKNEVYNSNPFSTSLSRQELADMSGMTKESFIRGFKELENSNIVRHEGHIIEILNEEDLVKISKNG